MKVLIWISFIGLGFTCHGQKSEELVPIDAMSVFSIDNIRLLQKISLDELVKYEFMEELHQEMFDGSTSGKDLKDSGIDFDQRFNVFAGQTFDYEITGFSFGVENRDKLFEVFDDFEPIPCDFEGVSLYASYFNRLAIKGNSGLLIRVSPNLELVEVVTDSIWYSRGNEAPWGYYNEDGIYEMFEEEGIYEGVEETIEFMEEMEIEEHTISPSDVEELPVANEDPNFKTYWELRDSVEMVLQNEYMLAVSKELFVHGDNLIKTAPRFLQQLQHTVDGVFYLDNERYFKFNKDTWYFQAMYPQLYLDINELYKGNVILGDLVIEDNSIELNTISQYGEDLGSIYKAMNLAKFDKNVIKYIHKDNSAFFTYNVNLREAYEQTLDIILPILEKETSSTISANLLVIELLDELMNKDAVFGTYKGSMFGTYQGVKIVTTKKIVFDYDEETYEYEEKEVEAEEEMPIFTLGYSTDRSDIPAKVMKRMDRLSDKITDMGEYWVFEDVILNAAPVYIINKNKLFIITNDENLAKNHSDGYGGESISKKRLKVAKKSGMIYAYADLGDAIEHLPRSMFSETENEMLDVIRGKSGAVQITSSGAEDTRSEMNLVYDFDGTVESSGTYILDLINSLYVFTK
jgi:hypothetical protein